MTEAQQQTETERLSIGALIANRLFAEFQKATDFRDFYRLYKVTTRRYMREATEHRDHDCFGFAVAQSLAALLTECLVKAQVEAGEGAAFATMRGRFIDLLEVQFRLYATIHTYEVPKAFAAEVRAEAAATTGSAPSAATRLH